MQTILFKLKRALFFRFLVVYVTVLCNIVLIISQSRLSIAQASSSFKLLVMPMFMYTTPTLVTEALCLVTQVQLLLMTITVK